MITRKKTNTVLTLASATMLLLAAAGSAQATTVDDSSTDPNIAGDWANTTHYGSAGTATWNAGDQDLDLVGGAGDKWSLLRRTAETRGPTDSVTLDIKEFGATGGDWAINAGLAITSTAAPTIFDTNPRYQFLLGPSQSRLLGIIPGKGDCG